MKNPLNSNKNKVLPSFTNAEIIDWLKTENGQKLEELWQMADRIRKENVGDGVHLRGIIEISNYCRRACQYCGINVHNKKARRYLMTTDEILEGAKEIASFDYGTVVLQAGEDFRIEANWVADLIGRIKDETGLAVTLGLGERKRSELELWKKAGADRYLLKLETGNPELYKKIHPDISGNEWSGRVELLQFLRETGYETGSGIMVGIPGQTHQDIANDLVIFRDLKMHMLGIGPYLPHPDTGLAADYETFKNSDEQVPNSELMTYKVNALARIICPETNIPTTTALATINKETGRELGLQRGANVIMPNFTPIKYRECYEIYPQRVCLEEFGKQVHQKVKQRIASINRSIATGAGASLKFTKEHGPIEN